MSDLLKALVEDVKPPLCELPGGCKLFSDVTYHIKREELPMPKVVFLSNSFLPIDNNSRSES